MESELNGTDEIEGEVLDEGNLSGIGLDLPPEHCHYRDEGCDLAASCLNCPFPQCVYEQCGGRQRWLKKLRNREIARLYNSKDKGIKELALMFGVSQRTVQRALKSTFSTSLSQTPLSSPSMNLGKVKSKSMGNILNEGDLSI